MLVRKSATKFALAITFLLAASIAYAQTYTVESGKTAVALSSGFVSALQSLNVTPGVISPTVISSGAASFPVVAGALDLNNLRGEILHSGGLTLADSNTRVRLQSFVIDTTGSKPKITGLVVVNGVLAGRIALFDLQLPAGIKLPLTPSSGGSLSLKGVGVTLDSTAAAALNKVFKVTAFQGGLKIGTASVYVMARSDSAN